VLWYCVADGAMVLATPGGTPRMLDNNNFAITANGQTIAYVDAVGDVDLDDLTGTQHRVLVPTTTPAGMQPQIIIQGATPERVLVWDIRALPSQFDLVSVADGASIVVADVHPMGTPFGAVRFVGASSTSADGSELLLQSTTGLVAVTLATGATRVISTFESRVTAGGAAFVDADRVLWVAVEDHSVGDEGSFMLSLHLASAGGDVVLARTQQYNVYWPTIGAMADEIVAVPGAGLIASDGTELASNPDSTDILGVTTDGHGAITLSSAGAVSLVGTNGSTHLASAGSVAGAQLINPYAAYTP